MLACICCGTVELTVAAVVIVPSVLAVVADYCRKPKSKDCANNEDKSETADVPA